MANPTTYTEVAPNPTAYTKQAKYASAYAIPVITFNLTTESDINLSTESDSDLLGTELP